MTHAVKRTIAALLLAGIPCAVLAQDAGVQLRSSGSEAVLELEAPVFYDRTVSAGVGEADNLGNHNATQDINAQWNRLVNLNNPTEDYHAATKWYVDQVAAGGGGGGTADNLGNHRATRDLNMSWSRIIDVNNPTDPYHAANKWYVDQAVAGVSGGAGDNMGDHSARQDISMNGQTLWNLGFLNMGGNDLSNAQIKGSTLHQPNSFGGNFQNAFIQWANVEDTYADRFHAKNSTMVDSIINDSRLNSPVVYFMEAYESTKFYGFNEHFNDVWMHGNQIKEAKIAHSLDMQQSPLINLRDPVDLGDAVNLRYVKEENRILREDIARLLVRVKALEEG